MRGATKLAGPACREKAAAYPPGKVPPHLRQLGSDKWLPWASEEQLTNLVAIGKAVVARDERGFLLIFHCDTGEVFFAR